ncbi:MAG TPA: TRIC cation channel family protein [Candidatus Avoscillospira avicola]|uniref:TRIC cation channel family protein n=1 Tax=Candidatus Avoscillospira avicola TaxID=2840706 RepID=A0A9D1DI63_9FIRM|nr:TRIC cation channel family protein [Candidatus Avoscillospira avicola]
MDWSLFLLTVVEMIGMVAFALNGALVGLKYHLDLFGVILVSVTVSLGGGVVRDLIIGRIPPAMFQDYRYLLVAVVTALLVFLAAVISRGRYHDYETKVEALANIFDALGLGAFTVVGVQAGINAGFSDNGFLLVFLGLLTGIGGGILRDLFVMRMPVVLRKHVYALPVIIGAALYLLCYRLGAPQLVTSGAVIFTVFALRMLATYYHWNLPHAP